MTEPALASCPVCGGASRQFAAVFGEMMVRREQARHAGAHAPGRVTAARAAGAGWERAGGLSAEDLATYTSDPLGEISK